MHKNGFTLVEIMVAVGIIALLSTFGLNNFKSVSQKSRDGLRKQHLTELSTALKIYFQQNGYYIKGSGNCDADTPTFYSAIAPLMANNSVPQDPLTKMSYCYQSVDNGRDFRLYARLEECPSQDTIPKVDCQTQYNYLLTSEDPTTLASAPPPPPPLAPAAVPQAAPAAAPQAQDSSLPPPPIATQLPVVCSYFNITESADPFGVYNTNESLLIVPELNWDNIAKVEVKQYEYPYPFAKPFVESSWKLLGTITRTPEYQCLRYETGSCEDTNECSCLEYDKKIVGYTMSGGGDRVCARRRESGGCAEWIPAVKWYTPNYPGIYYLGMEAYDSLGKKVAGPNTDNTFGCTKDIFAQRWTNTCRDNRPVSPTNLKTSVVGGNTVLIQWLVTNSSSTYDSSMAYGSSQANFTTALAKKLTGNTLKLGTSNGTDGTFSLPTEYNSNHQWAYFSNLTAGKHYFAVKTKNNCGNGWSNIVSAEIGAVQGVSTTLVDQLKTIFQSLLWK